MMTDSFWQQLQTPPQPEPSNNLMQGDRVEQKPKEKSRPVRLAKGLAAHNMKPLPFGYVLGEYDVICGRGSTCFNHIGNQRFRKMVADSLDEYSGAAAKLEKTYIICDIVHRVRQQSPNGGFVKKDPLTGGFFEVGDFLAREKTSQAFRDALHDQYKSSNAAKKKRRVEENGGPPKLRKQLSAPSLAGAKSIDMLQSNENSSETKKRLMIQLENELNASFNRPNDGNAETNDEFDFAPSNVGNETKPAMRRSCPDLSQLSGFVAFQAAGMANQIFDGVVPPAPRSDNVSAMACGKRNDLMERLMEKFAKQQVHSAQPAATPSAEQPSTMPPPASAPTPTIMFDGNNSASSVMDCNIADTNMDLFDKLVKVTEGCSATGNPFDPIPFDPNPSNYSDPEANQQALVESLHMRK